MIRQVTLNLPLLVSILLLLLLAWPTQMSPMDNAEAEEISLERSKRGISLSVPTVFAGLRVSPSVWRWMINAYGVSAITGIGVSVAESDADARSKRVPCCSGYLNETRSIRDCTRREGECCSREKTDYANKGIIGLNSPKKLGKKDKAGNCYQCFSHYTICRIGI